MKNVLSPVLPTRWEDLSDEQLCAVHKLLQVSRSEAELKVACFCRFNKISILSVFSKTVAVIWHRKRMMIDKMELYLAIDKLSWVASPPSVPVFFHSFKGRSNIDRYLHSFSLGNWLTVDNLYLGYLATNNPQMLSDCLKVMLGLKKSPKLKDWETSAVLYWIVGIKEYLASLYPTLFPKPADGNTQSPQQMAIAARKNTDAILRTLSKADITKYEDVLECGMYMAFAELDALAKESLELKRISKRK